MDRKTIIISTLFSTLAAIVTALAVCAVFFFYKPAVRAEKPARAVETEATPPKKTESVPFPQVEIKESDVTALTIETVYKNFYAEGSKCRQNYNEYFKNTDGVGSSSSPCNVKLTLNRDGSAEKEIEVRRYDTAAREWRVVEKTSWKANITVEEFKDLAKLVTGNEAFKNWSDNISINVSNCRITAKHANGTKSPMSNVDERATDYLPMVVAFKNLDAKIDWQKTN